MAHEREHFGTDPEADRIRLHANEVRLRLVHTANELKQRLGRRPTYGPASAATSMGTTAEAPRASLAWSRWDQPLVTWVRHTPVRALVLTLAGGVALGWLLTRK